MLTIRKLFAVLLVSAFLIPAASFGERGSEPEKLEQLIKKINERQSKNLKVFEKKAKAYFFDSQKPEVIEILLKDFPPGDAVAIIVLSNHSKRPVKEIVNMKKSGINWQGIAEKAGVKLKNVIKDVRDFRSGIG